MGDDPRTEWTEFFDREAAAYDDHEFTKNTLAEVDFLVDVLGLQRGMAVLDVGCGTGRHAVELARRGYRVTGVDVSSGMLAEARRRADQEGVVVRWIESDAQRFSASDEFDAVICLCEGACGLLGSVDDPIGQPQAIIENAAQAMKVGARCVFTVLNAFALIRKYDRADVEEGLFDPVALTERSECRVPGAGSERPLRERGFVPTELVLLFALAGVEISDIWGGTAGSWGRRPIDLDEIEIMLVGTRRPGPLELPHPIFV